MLAIPLISAKCERVFSSTKHLITNSRNRLKADIIEVNKCLKSWYGRPEAKAFKQGVDPNVDDLYKEEAAAKAKAKAEAAIEAAAKKDSNTQDDADQHTGEQKGKQAEEAEEEDVEDKEDKDDSIKYIVIDN